MYICIITVLGTVIMMTTANEYSPRKRPPIHGRIPVVHGSVPVVRARIPLTDVSGIHRNRDRYRAFTACTSRMFSLPA